MATNVLRHEENPRITLPRRQVPMGTGRAPAISNDGLRRHASVFGAGAIGPRTGRGAADFGLAATDVRSGESSRGSLYPLRILARVFFYIGIATVFYAAVLVVIFVQSDMVSF